MEAGILGTGVPSSGDAEAGVLPGASLRQDIAQVILRSRVPLRPGSGATWSADSCRRWKAYGLLMMSWETVEPGVLMFPEEELRALTCRG
ncbi:hypothetical protein F2Q68_00038987 [Brassica cretica]|uniref:DUF4050 domain-containing protein n=2 Tax=Brassica cretica TaxID=69181 RepID=A0ABQ7AH40_BRACR|nr:hypothetical protein F2Q68_00038987 [Brassica cretica]KAF3496987.1 hypothetical protein DY000_02052563 [Brassica cretica]